MRRGLLLLSTVLVVLVVAPAATADKPNREVNPSQEDVTVDDQCAFPVLGHVNGGEIITTFTDRFGNPIRQVGVFPGNTMTLTNLDTGKSIAVAATGAFHARVENPDGSGSVAITGPGLVIPNPVTGESGIWYLKGRMTFGFDANQNMTSIDSVAGNLVNLCPQLAS